MPRNSKFFQNQTKYRLYQTKDLWINLIIHYLEKAKTNNELKKNINTDETSHAIYGSLIGVAVLSKINTDIKELESNLKIHLNIFK